MTKVKKKKKKQELKYKTKNYKHDVLRPNKLGGLRTPFGANIKGHTSSVCLQPLLPSRLNNVCVGCDQSTFCTRLIYRLYWGIKLRVCLRLFAGALTPCLNSLLHVFVPLTIRGISIQNRFDQVLLQDHKFTISVNFIPLESLWVLVGWNKWVKLCSSSSYMALVPRRWKSLKVYEPLIIFVSRQTIKKMISLKKLW